MSEKNSNKDIEALNEYIGKELGQDDVKLLKKYFAKDQHSFIEDNRDTPIYILELKTKQPQKIIGFTNAVIPVVISFVLLYISTFNLTVDLPFQVGYLIVIVIFGTIVVATTLFFSYKFTKMDEQWLICKYMIALKKGGKKRKAVLLYLKNEAKKLDKEDIE